MISVVITEDEMLVRLGLKMCMDSCSDIRVVGAFASGEETVEFFAHNTADALITDVRLTGMDGLELIRRVRPASPNMAIIVLSCYEDFSYARTALNNGADRYYLKHEISEEEIPQVIRELAAKRQKRPDDFGKVRGAVEGAENAQMTGDMYAVYFSFRGAGEAKNTGGDELNLDMISGIIQSIMDNAQLGRCFLCRDGGIGGLIKYDSALGAAENGMRLRQFFNEVSRTMENCTGKNCFMGVSEKFSFRTSASAFIEQAKKAAGYSFYSDASSLFFYPPSKDPECPRLQLLRENIFTQSWQRHQLEFVQQFFKECIAVLPPPEQVKEAIVQFLHFTSAYAEQYYRSGHSTVFPKEFEPNYGNVSRFDSILCLKTWLINVMQLAVDYVSAQLDAGLLIRQYLESHYKEEISQTELAAVFHMSSAYFCQYFKKTLGLSFVQYLNQLRLEKAKHLLKTTGMSTEEVAEAVGIPNANYFFRLFKKQEGCTVKEYRRRSLGESAEQ